ncbi:MAG: DNA-processing protein DprA [Clostridia bacterium]|nr:DNA-processing protein DprA [Clostridia bacterium]
MKCGPEYWIWLQKTLGAGNSCDEILQYFGNPAKLYESGKKAWLESGLFSEKTLGKLISSSPSETYHTLKACQDNGWHIVTYEDEYYPSLLRQIKNYPLVLYVYGDKEVLKTEFAIGIVGTRNASEYGRQAAMNLSYNLAKAGSVIVSGGALGIDSFAHEGAIKAGGKTIAVLGNGLGSTYLRQNEALRDTIAQNGAVITELLPFTDPSRTTFPVRNRLISGISRGLLVVEAGEKSGSLITAGYAAEQGRDIFAVAGSIFCNGYNGTNNLIRDGAKSVFSANDILEVYAERFSRYINLNATGEQLNQAEKMPEKQVSEKPVVKEKKEDKPIEQKKGVLPEIPDFLSDNAKKLAEFITDEPKTSDKLSEDSEMPISDVLPALTELEMFSVIEMHSGKRYTLKII